MKKTFRYLTAAIAVLSLFTTSCHDDIYGKINREVALENCGINGDIMSFVRHGDNIYISNGNIYYKSTEPSKDYYPRTGDYNRQWKKSETPVSDSLFGYDAPATTHYLASDSTYMYSLSYSWYENTDGVNSRNGAWVYWTDDTDPSDGLTWNGPIDFSAITGETYSAASANNASYVKIIFDNQTVNASERHAYVTLYNATDKVFRVYMLNGGTAPSTPVSNGASTRFINTTDTDIMPSAINCARYNGCDWFSNYYAMAGGENYFYYSPTETNSSNNVSGSTVIYCSKGNNPTAITLDATSILSIGVAKDYFLLGTTSGLHHVAVDENGIPSNKISDFSVGNNGESIITEWVFKVFILDPSKSEDGTNSTGTDEYCASTIHGSISSSADSFPKSGLYSFYPGRKTWNRDGTADTASGGN